MPNHKDEVNIHYSKYELKEIKSKYTFPFPK